MPIYRYIKAPPGYTIKKPLRLSEKLKVAASVLFMGVGITALTTVAYPLLSYQITVAPKLQKPTRIAPQTKQPLEVAQVQANEPYFAPEIINTALDYTNANTWFPQAQPQTQTKGITRYSFSVPKLGITNAVVKVGGEDLKQSLIHYGGTALPGELGNAVVFGHSVLPQFFDPKNYTSIFSTIHTLDIGDEFLINADGVEYRYVIRDMYEVEPTDLSPLAQTYDNYYLTVITCAPPGTYLRRLIIKATLT